MRSPSSIYNLGNSRTGFSAVDHHHLIALKRTLGLVFLDLCAHPVVLSTLPYFCLPRLLLMGYRYFFMQSYILVLILISNSTQAHTSSLVHATHALPKLPSPSTWTLRGNLRLQWTTLIRPLRVVDRLSSSLAPWRMPTAGTASHRLGNSYPTSSFFRAASSRNRFWGGAERRFGLPW